MWKRLWILFIILCTAACESPSADSTPIPTVPPFPTVTPGQLLRAPLPPPAVIPLTGGSINPAGQIASRPTATPNLRACPMPVESVRLVETVPPTGRSMELAIESYLSSGGTLVGLQRDLAEVWNALGGTGFIRGDLDITGEGSAEIIISLTTPDEGGTLMIFGCFDGRIIGLYREGIGGEAPAILNAVDMNADGRTDVLFASQDCITGACRVSTQLAGSIDGVRVVNLLSGVLDSESPVRVDDLDQDRVNEIVLQYGGRGSAETGPQRTGFTVYDWDGLVYTEALTQTDPPRYLIQAVFDGDQAFAANQYEQAAAIYNAALNNAALENWQPDDRTVLTPYLLYRMLLAYSALGDSRRSEVQQAILTAYPDPVSQPVYAAMALTFWNAFQITNNVNSACQEVLSIIAARPEALSLLNRYGSSNPAYSAQDVCPF